MKFDPRIDATATSMTTAFFGWLSAITFATVVGLSAGYRVRNCFFN